MTKTRTPLEAAAGNPFRRGWGKPSNSRNMRYHFFVDGRSLCGRYEDPGHHEMQILSGPLIKGVHRTCSKCIKTPMPELIR